MFLVASRKTFRNWKSSKNYQKIICRKINSKISSMYTKQNWYHPYITFIVTNVVIFDRKYRGPTLAYRVSLKVCCVSESVERSWTVLNKDTLSVFFEIQKNSDIEFFDSNQFVRNVWNLESVWSRNFCYATTLSRLCLFNKSQGHYVFVVTYLDNWIELDRKSRISIKQKYRVFKEIWLLTP